MATLRSDQDIPTVTWECRGCGMGGNFYVTDLCFEGLSRGTEPIRCPNQCGAFVELSLSKSDRGCRRR
jgi:hypothetical protein